MLQSYEKVIVRIERVTIGETYVITNQMDRGLPWAICYIADNKILTFICQ